MRCSEKYVDRPSIPDQVWVQAASGMRRRSAGVVTWLRQWAPVLYRGRVITGSTRRRFWDTYDIYLARPALGLDEAWPVIAVLNPETTMVSLMSACGKD
jgi:hypothetical protein